MYANEKVIANMDVLKLLEHYNFNTTNYAGSTIRSACTIHGGNNPTSFVINTDSGLWYCHSGCGGGDIFTLVERMEDITFKESVEFLSKFFDIDVSGLNISQNKNKLEKELKNFVGIIKRSHTSPLETFKFVADTVGMKSYRNFTKDTLDAFNVVYAKSIELFNKNGELYTALDRILIAIIFEGLQIGISLRKTKSADFPKWSHQPRGLKVNEMLYNYDRVIGENVLIVTEGMFDVWAYHEIGLPAVCTFGANISHQQYVLLLQTGADIVMSYDEDKAGREGTRKALELFKNKANIYKVQFNEGDDPASITREELLELYGKRKRY